MLKLDHVNKSFASPGGHLVQAIGDISITIGEREFVAFLGSSGCGKTTLLKIIAGLDKPTKGRVIFENQEIRSTSKERGMVFQDFALFPWLSISENIAFGLRLRQESTETIQSVVSHYLRLTELEQFKDSFPQFLSGGMQQRVAIARTLANDPKILLLDEPFGALDVQTRSQMQEFLAKLWEEEHKTVVLVTHDIEEALFLADRVFLLSPRPAMIASVLDIPFPRPRRRELKLSDGFFKMKKEVSSLLQPYLRRDDGPPT
jgi:NitT/TauT family transport system ATP-binding protein